MKAIKSIVLIFLGFMIGGAVGTKVTTDKYSNAPKMNNVAANPAKVEKQYEPVIIGEYTAYKVQYAYKENGIVNPGAVWYDEYDATFKPFAFNYFEATKRKPFNINKQYRLLWCTLITRQVEPPILNKP